MEECCIYEPVLEKLRRGESIKLAIPIYDSKTKEWIHDVQRFALRADYNLDKSLSMLPSTP